MVKTETRHLTTGDTLPAFPDDKLTLISMRFCPYAQRIHLVLDAKQIPHHVVNVCILKRKPEWLTTLNPENKVPILRLTNESAGEIYLTESLNIAHYLDEKYPERLLYPKDPLAKEADREFIKKLSPITAAYYRLMVTREPSLLDAFFNDLDSFETELVKRGTTFFSGVEPGMVDYMLWPWFERRNVFHLLMGDQAKWDPKSFEKLIEWSETMETDNAVKNTWLPTEVHAEFAQNYVPCTIDYDMLVKH